MSIVQYKRDEAKQLIMLESRQSGEESVKPIVPDAGESKKDKIIGKAALTPKTGLF